MSVYDTGAVTAAGRASSRTKARHRAGGGKNGDVQEDDALTLDAWVLAVVTEEVENGDERARRVAAGVGEDADGGDDAGDPAAIPCTRTKRTSRRRRRRGSICSGRSQSTATSSAAMARFRSSWEKENKEGERASGQGLGFRVLFLY